MRFKCEKIIVECDMIKKEEEKSTINMQPNNQARINAKYAKGTDDSGISVYKREFKSNKIR